MSSLLCGRPACMLLWHRRWCTPPARHCFSDLRAMCWLELMFPECTTVFSLESLLWVSALIMFLLLSPQTLQWVSREYSDTGGSDFSASEAAYGRLTLGSPAGMSTRIYVCLQWWKLLLFFFSFLSKSSLLSHLSTRKYPKIKAESVYKEVCQCDGEDRGWHWRQH